jgi:hypothetical protein
VLAELLDLGCKAAGYRLAGPELDHVCCRHLYGNDRMLTVWLGSDHAVVIAVGPHDRSAGDLYRGLVEALKIDAPEEERSKPPCCDEAGQPPVHADTAAAIVAAVESLQRPRHRQRNR